MTLLSSILAIVAAYLLGSVSFAVVVSRLMGIQDPRTFGSGNPGATNVLRSGSKKAAILTLLLDALKGYIPVVLAIYLTPQLGWPFCITPMVGLAAFLGHLYPVFFGFKGGKGVATAAGVLLAISPLMALAVLATWLLVAVATRYSSLASLVAAALAPAFYALFHWNSGVNVATVAAIAVMAIFLIYRHRSNIQKLIAGTESKIGQKKS
ncbi:MAG: glycerol-3-phosphate 1-O-acyltransferase PlsY [Saezia sp.]